MTQKGETMRAAIIYNTVYEPIDWSNLTHDRVNRVSARIVDLDRKEYEEFKLSNGKTVRNGYWPELWHSEPQETVGAAQREAEAWGAAQHLTLHDAPAPRGVSGAEADIEANYPGGYAAYLRDERSSNPTSSQEANAVESGQIGGASGVDI